MTCGIYLLSFIGTSGVYIGQSINIETRFIQHLSKLRLGTANQKLQQAYNTYGRPNLSILEECSIEQLDSREYFYIQRYNAAKEGLNVLELPGPPDLYGERVGTATSTNDTYLRILELLVQTEPSLTKREIAEITGCSIYVVRHIAALESHTWMQEVRPDLYAKLKCLHKDTPYYTGKVYPKVQSPTGEVFNVTHVTNFAKEHGLSQSKLSLLLNGTRQMHKGWRLYKVDA